MRQLKITNRITNRESFALDKYLQDIGKIDLLSPEEEADLARKIRAGDQEALDKLHQGQPAFVVSVAKQYQNHGLSLSDLINEGNVGLMKAAKRFDETKGFKFISYAVWWIRQSILQAIVEYSRIVRLPLNKVGSYNRVNETYLSFVQEFEREPTVQELADILEISPREVTSVLEEAAGMYPSMPSFNGMMAASTMLDLLPTDDDAQPDLRLMEESLKQR